jgi:CheY-like chemotaxis protein
MTHEILPDIAQQSPAMPQLRSSGKERAFKVLIVDDEPDLCRILVRLLTRSGLEAASVTSGQAALEFIRSHSVKVMLLDIMMPVMNGFDVLKELRGGRDFSGLPVVIYSASNDAETREKAQRLGAQEFVAKASDSFDYLREVLGKFL